MKHVKQRKLLHLRESIWEEETRLKNEAKTLLTILKNNQNERGTKFLLSGR